MYAKQEKRALTDKPLWLAKYKNLNNLLHYHDELEIIWINEGKANIFIDNTLFKGKKDNVFIIDNAVPHNIVSDENTTITVIQVDKTHLTEFSSFKLSSPKLSSSYNIDVFLVFLNNDFKKTNKFSSLYYLSIIRTYLALIFNNEKIEENTTTSSWTKNILQYMNQHFFDLNFSETASYFGYSEAYFSRLFKKTMGSTFTDYANRIKINHALKMLEKGDMSITDISTRCGFNSIRHFNRIFKSITGTTPLKTPKTVLPELTLVSSASAFDPTLQPSQRIEF